jgi:CRP/FNR family transcriptional regulator
MIEPGQANFVSREALLQFLRSNTEVAVRAGQVLSLNYYNAHEEIRTLGVTRSPEERLAKLLLSWFPAKDGARAAQIKLTFTHTEIAEMIGATRETVTRLFTDFTRRHIIQRTGATLMLRDKPALLQIMH